MANTGNRISRITVRGFKSICSEQNIEIKPLTILAGANSSGKSSMLQPLLLLKQTLDAPSDPGALLLDGPNARFTLTDQLLSRFLAQSSEAEFIVRIELLEGQSLELAFRQEANRGFGVARMVYADHEDRIMLTPRMTHQDILVVLPKQMEKLREDLMKTENTEFQWLVRRERCFLTFDLASAEKPELRGYLGPYGASPGLLFLPYVQGAIHLPGLRGNPRRTYPRTAGGPDFPGTFEPYVASVISHWQAGDKGKLTTLGKALEQMGLSWKVTARRVDDTQVELKVGRLPHSKQGGARDLVNIADVGLGISQLLPVVVSLLVAKPGQLVYLEQPEIHLHPLAQRRLAVVLAQAAVNGVVVVVETHSALLLREVQTLIATRRISKDNVALHWFRRSDDGSTSVESACLDSMGAYGDWPEDFDQTELDAEQSYLDAVELRGDE